jgi:hypothetical protein
MDTFLVALAVAAGVVGALVILVYIFFASRD